MPNKYEVSETEADEEFVMVGYPIPRKRLYLQGVEYIANVKWGAFASPQVSTIGNSRFVFRFDSQDEIDEVLEAGPWVFDGVIMGLMQVTSNEEFEDEITKMSFWVQIHNLPSHSFRESTVRRIAENIGSFREVSFEDEDGEPYEDIVRVRLIMDLRKSFPPAIKLTRENRWIYVKYEKLPSICKYCGLITHDEEDCRMIYSVGSLSRIPQKLQEWAQVPISGIPRGQFHFPFGEWMCAQPYRR